MAAGTKRPNLQTGVARRDVRREVGVIACDRRSHGPGRAADCDRGVDCIGASRHRRRGGFA